MSPLAVPRRPAVRRALAAACVAAGFSGTIPARAGDPAREETTDPVPADAVTDRVETAAFITNVAPPRATGAPIAPPRATGAPAPRPLSPRPHDGTSSLDARARELSDQGGRSDWKVLGALLGAFSLLAGLRFMHRRRDPALPLDVFEVLGNAPFAGPHSVRVVRFGPRTLLVAVSSGGCATLAEISDAEATARIAAACRGAAPRRRTSSAVSDGTPALPASQSDTPDRPGRRIAAAAIGWTLCLLASTAAAEPVPETLTTVPTSPPAVERDAFEPAGQGRSATATTDVGLARLLPPRVIETVLPSALLFGVMSLVPAVLLMTTCFVRISIVLMLLRQGLGAAQVPSNQILASLALFLSALVMWPVWTEAWRDGVEPYRQGVLEPAEAFDRGTLPIRRWMSTQIEAAGNRDTMLLFLARHPAGRRQATSYDDVPLETLLPAFLVSELDTAFAIGFRMLVPFLVLDILVATLVVSTGLVMLPPTLVSLPLKLLVFVAADGWTLVVRGLLDGVGMPAG